MGLMSSSMRNNYLSCMGFESTALNTAAVARHPLKPLHQQSSLKRVLFIFNFEIDIYAYRGTDIKSK